MKRAPVAVWLLERLAEGPMMSMHLKNEVEALGWPRSSLRWAGEHIGVVAYQEGRSWWWRLPTAQDRLERALEGVDLVEVLRSYADLESAACDLLGLPGVKSGYGEAHRAAVSAAVRAHEMLSPLRGLLQNETSPDAEEAAGAEGNTSAEGYRA